MVFAEKVKEEAKRRAHYSCVVCHAPFVEVHHIKPQEEGGEDIIENAAPLCARCHHIVGGNPELRKQLKSMRDFWWEICEKNENQNLVDIAKRLDEMKLQIEETKTGTKENTRTLNDLKNTLSVFYSETAKEIRGASTFAEVRAISGAGVSLTSDRCYRCGKTIDSNERYSHVC